MTIAVELYIILKLLFGAPLDVQVTPAQGLPPWYAPGPNPAASLALDRMVRSAGDDDIKIWISSGYRSFFYQQEVNRREGDLHPDRYWSYTAAPGHSEHQLGTAFDLAWPGLPVGSLDIRNLELYQWLELNAHQYGFVITYPYKEIDEWPYHNRWMPMVTEYIYEPWHLRYVGTTLAQEMRDDGYLDPLTRVLPQDYYTPWP